MNVDAFSQEVHNRLCQLPAEKAAPDPLWILLLIACDVAEDFLRDNPRALQEFIEARAREERS